MSEIEKAESNEPVATPAQQPSHGEMFFRYVAALAQAAGVQGFTMAIAVPKDDGTSAVLSLAAAMKEAPREWQEELSRLLGESAVKAALTIVQPLKEAEKPAVEVV